MAKKKHQKLKTLEEDILILQEEAKEKDLSIGEILNVLSGKGRFLIIILLCLPFCQPIQIPGFSTLFGIAIAFLGLRVAFGKRVWLPQKLLYKKIPAHTIDKLTQKTLAIMKMIKPWIHPRLSLLTNSSLMEIVNGLFIFFLGILLALPLPIPLSNLTAAWSIFLISLGMLEDDGISVAAGYLISLITLIFFLIMAITAHKIFLDLMPL